jgi:O-acetylhomoserine (thiol)-lyase
LSPFNAHAFINGLETLHLRVRRHSENALKVARWLQKDPRVAWVRYPGLEDDPAYPLARRYLDGGFGGLVSFGVKGGFAEGKALIDRVKLFSLLANIGDARSLIIHPASTTHQQLSPEEQRSTGVTEDLVRLSVGLEHPDDILADLDRSLGAR